MWSNRPIACVTAAQPHRNINHLALTNASPRPNIHRTYNHINRAMVPSFHLSRLKCTHITITFTAALAESSGSSLAALLPLGGWNVKRWMATTRGIWVDVSGTPYSLLLSMAANIRPSRTITRAKHPPGHNGLLTPIHQHQSLCGCHSGGVNSNGKRRKRECGR